ncbi:DUF2934 domain-containing protein [Roseixanthobacter psychrophilus]|uniref:DUF2934 domain-containing protein n=1 Tax=Roseixanthobacter psychrophilus TaxID=3119917 RepID=UPI003D1D0834
MLRKRTAERAYALWEGEGRLHGRHLDHWCQAETETTVSAATGSIPNSQKPSAAPSKADTKARSRKR